VESPKKKILLVRLRLIGDVVFTTPVIRALRRHFADAHLAYLVEPLAEPVIRANPHLDEIIVAPRRRGAARMADDVRVAARLRRERFDIAIDLHGGPRGAWFTWASRAPTRIGYATAGRSWMYTDAVPRPADLGPMHSVLKQWALLQPLGIGPADPMRDAVEMPLDQSARAAVDRWLADAGIRPADPLVVLHVSAGNPFRRWPAGAFASLVADLARRDPSRRFVLTSGPSDASAAQAIADRAREQLGPRPAAIVHGQFAIDELRALSERAAVYIGGDSGPLHIASTTTTPVVALFGPTLAERSMPWRDRRWFAEAVDAGPLPCRPCRQRTCEPGDFRCLTRIAPERVADAVERALGVSNKAQGTTPKAQRRLSLSLEH
jgi:lipopolysaccharide heptosyltransferase II